MLGIKQKIKYSVLWVFFSTFLNAGGGKCHTPPISEVVPITSTVEYYVSVGLSSAGIRRLCECATQKVLKDLTYGGLAIAGVKFNKYISIEARVSDVSIEKDFSTTKYYGISLKPTYEINDKITAYLTLGYGKVEAEGAGLNNYDTLLIDGFSFGGGVDYSLSSHWSVWGDWQNLLYKVTVFNTSNNLLSLGVTYHF